MGRTAINRDFIMIGKQIVNVTSFIFLLLFSVFSYSATLEKITVMSDGHPMALWHKQNQTNIAANKQILLLHGRTWSALPDFDLQVEGESLSVMDNLAELGYSVWALDARGYGATPRDKTGWNSPNKASGDVATVLAWIAKRTNSKVTLFGWSYGSMVALLTAQKHPELMSSVILYGFPIDPDEKINWPKTPDAPPQEKNTAKNAASDFIVEGSISAKAVETYVIAALKADPFRADWNQVDQWDALDGRELTVPLLLLQGEFDPYFNADSYTRFFTVLPNANKQWVVLKGGDHAALLEKPKDQFIQSIDNFIEWLEK